MALKGTTRIELTNVKTGEKEVIEKTNMVTNAVNDILSIRPFGMRYRNYSIWDGTMNSSGEPVKKSFEDVVFPVVPNLIGGILLYEEALEENPDKYYAPIENPVIGYSNNEVSPSTDERRGSMNQTESGKLTDGTGYRFVFDFETSQANGTIASLGMTSKWGGESGYGWEGAVDFPYHAMLVDATAQSIDFAANYNSYCKGYISIVSIDPDNNTALAAFVSAVKTVILMKFRLPMTSMGMLKTFTPSLESLETYTIATSQFAETLTNNVFYGTLIDGQDGYIWGFQHSGNAKGNASGAANILWIRISKEDFSFTEGSFTVNAPLLHFGDYYVPVSSTVGNQRNINYAIIKDGTLYAIGYTSTKYMYTVYGVSLDNPTNVQEYKTDHGWQYDPASWGGGYHYASTAVNELNGCIKYPFGELSGGKLRFTSSAQRSSNSSVETAGAIFSCPKPQLFWGPYVLAFNHASNTYRRILVYLMTTYLATINNLPTPVEKTADKTMKITYILREES